MEKQIRNARKRVSPSNAAKRRRLSSLPEQSSGTRQTLPAMPNGAQKAEQGTKTVEIIDGIPYFYLVIPCSIDKPSKVQPLYLVKENELGGAESGVWQCQECARIFHSHRSWEKHKGIRWITGPEIKVCA